jgi:hypothetical protein
VQKPATDAGTTNSGTPRQKTVYCYLHSQITRFFLKMQAAILLLALLEKFGYFINVTGMNFFKGQCFDEKNDVAIRLFALIFANAHAICANRRSIRQPEFKNRCRDAGQPRRIQAANAGGQ